MSLCSHMQNVGFVMLRLICMKIQAFNYLLQQVIMYNAVVSLL